MKIRALLFFALFFTGQVLVAQNLLTITGKVLDKESGAPLAYAHVGIPEKGIGTTSGPDGAFTLKVPDRYVNSTLIASFIGYATYRKDIGDLGSVVTIFLEPAPSELAEVLVMGESAVENIIREAVRRIPENFPDHPTTVLGFYRESRTDDSLNHLYLAEGVLQVYKTSYRNAKEGMVSLVQGRKMNLRNPLDTAFASQFTSGHMAAHRFDFVKNRIDFIAEAFFPVYSYWLEGKTFYNDRPVYIIRFEPTDEREAGRETEEEGGGSVFDVFQPKMKKKRKVITGRMKGRIYIDQDSYAFLRAEFEITAKGLKKYNDYPLYSGNWKANSYVVNYRQLDGKWYFSDAVREGVYGGGGTYNNEVKITEINAERSGPLPYLERLERGDAFTEVTGVYDPDFWRSYNVTPLSEGLAESVRQLETIRKAQEVFDPENMARLQQQRDSIQKLEVLKAEGVSEEGFGDDFGPAYDLDFPGIGRQREKRDYPRFKFMPQLGTHFLETAPGRMSITYLTEGADPPETVISVEETVSERSVEIFGGFDLDFFLHKNFFVRGGFRFDFANSIYRERSLGLGAQFNLSRQRPFYFRAIAQHSNFRYARKVGTAANDYGKFEVDGKKFNADRISLYYGSRTHNLKLSAEWSIELNPARELFLRGTFFLPFARRQDVWFRERGQLFNKKKRIPASDDHLLITRDGAPFDGPIMPEQHFSVSVGLMFF